MSVAQEGLREYLRTHPGATRSEIATQLGFGDNYIGGKLLRAVNSGYIRHEGRGTRWSPYRYFAVLLILAGVAGAVDLPYSPATLPATTFPVSPAGMCLDGSEALFSSYQAAGLNPVLLYNLPSTSTPGHVWVAVQSGQGWQAVDSYFGPVSSDEFYHADMSFTDTDSLRAAFPRRSVL